MDLRSNAPDVKVVHIVDSTDGADRRLNFFQLHTAGRAFQQNIERLAYDAVARPQDEHSDAK